MKTTRLIVPLILFLTVAVINANGQSIKNRSHNERERIAQGSRSGELTHRERTRLAHEQKEIHKDVRDAKKDDGHISHRERKQIKREQRKASHDIYRAKHNRRTK